MVRGSPELRFHEGSTRVPLLGMSPELILWVKGRKIGFWGLQEAASAQHISPPPQGLIWDRLLTPGLKPLDPDLFISFAERGAGVMSSNSFSVKMGVAKVVRHSCAPNASPKQSLQQANGSATANVQV